ncbi:hypothetical protein BDZ91DRAFT_795296 [Kalaharituber pfeilii]|nr:hypothetical protein BDZ91DRAFT_795296 [Kalaharituber pfeilii]
MADMLDCDLKQTKRTLQSMAIDAKEHWSDIPLPPQHSSNIDPSTGRYAFEKVCSPDGDDDGDDDGGNREKGDSRIKDLVEKCGFIEEGMPSSLYQYWRSDVSNGLRDQKIVGRQAAGAIRWADFCQWAAHRSTFAPLGQQKYATNNDIKHAVNLLCQDIAKKLRESERTRDQLAIDAAAAYQGVPAAAGGLAAARPAYGGPTIPPGAINDDPTFPRAIQIYTVDPDTMAQSARRSAPVPQWPCVAPSLAIHLPTPTLAALVAAYGPAIPAGRTIGEWWIKTRTFFKVEQDFHFSVALWTLRNEAVVEVQAILNSAPAPPTPARRGHKRAAGGCGQGGSGNRDGGGSRGSRGASAKTKNRPEAPGNVNTPQAP